MKVNAVFDENGAWLSGELPANIPSDLNEISGFCENSDETQFLQLAVDDVPYFCIVTPFVDGGNRFFTACFLPQFDVARELSPEIDTAFLNSIAICRNGLQNIALLGQMISQIFDQIERYGDKRLVADQIKNCHKALRGIQNVEEVYAYMNNRYVPQIFKPYDIVAPMVSEIKKTIKYTNKKVEFICENKEIKIFADPKRFENVVLNLFSNAIVYSGDEAEIGISIKTFNEKVVISVFDNGFGMSSEDCKKACDAGFTTKGEKFKQGLGLYLANKFAKHTGGTIFISSAENEGTTVTITVPKADGDAMNLEAKVAEYQGSSFSPIAVALSDIGD